MYTILCPQTHRPPKGDTRETQLGDAWSTGGGYRVHNHQVYERPAFRTAQNRTAREAFSGHQDASTTLGNKYAVQLVWKPLFTANFTRKYRCCLPHYYQCPLKTNSLIQHQDHKSNRLFHVIRLYFSLSTFCVALRGRGNGPRVCSRPLRAREGRQLANEFLPDARKVPSF